MSLRHPVDSWLLVSRSSGYITNDSVCLIWRMPQCVIYDSWLPVSYNRLMASCVVYDSSLLVSHMTHGSLYTWLMTRWCLIDRLIASCVVYDSWLVGVLYIDLSLRVSFMTHGSLCVTWLMTRWCLIYRLIASCVVYDSWFLVCYMTHVSVCLIWLMVPCVLHDSWLEPWVMRLLWKSHVAHKNESCHTHE